MLCVICLMFTAVAFAGTTTYVYDELDRLHEVNFGNNIGIRYEYDEIGNLLSKTPFGNVYTLTSSASEGGSISPMGTLTITAGSSKSYSFTPLYGYNIDDVVVDGVSLGVVSSYPFNNISASHTIAASFATEINAWVQGAVKDPLNNPLEGVEIQLRSADATKTKTAITTSDGSYRISAYAGNWLVDALSEKLNWSAVPEQGITLTAGQTATVNFTVNALSLITSTLADGFYSINYNQALAASGGMPPYIWTLSDGSMQTGLSLNASTGTITGIPTAIGTSVFTVQVQDARGVTSAKTFSLKVSYPPVRIDGAIPTYFTSLQAAYNNALDGANISCQAVSLTENLVFGQDKTVTVTGGFDPLYTSSTGVTTIHGALNITAGKVPMRSVDLQY